MTVKEIEPKSRINAVIKLFPGSKSYTNRALICAYLANGVSVLENAALCDDTRAMVSGLRRLGADIQISGNCIYVTGIDFDSFKQRPLSEEIYVGSAGTTMRFLTGLCSLIKGHHRLTGTPRMYERPIDDLVDILNQVIDGEVVAESTNKDGRKCPPIEINSNGLIGGNVKVRVDTSSQFLSSLLMASPYAWENITIRPEKLVEKSYVDMTVKTMGNFGVEVEEKNGIYLVRVGQKYKPITYFVESDASNATYFMAAAAITEGKISIGRFRKDSKQGDLGFINILEQMGCTANWNGEYIEIQGPDQLNGIEEIDLGAMPDTVQTLAVLAAVAKGKTTIRGTRNLKYKETDRISALEKELDKVGIQTQSTEDSLTVYGSNPKPAVIETYDDHRMVMAFSVLGLKVPGIRIINPECVSKSSPNFYKLFDKL